VIDTGMQVALDFFGLGLLWIFVAGVLLGMVAWIKDFLG
jgi:hypothetical protein